KKPNPGPAPGCFIQTEMATMFGNVARRLANPEDLGKSQTDINKAVGLLDWSDLNTENNTVAGMLPSEIKKAGEERAEKEKSNEGQPGTRSARVTPETERFITVTCAAIPRLLQDYKQHPYLKLVLSLEERNPSVEWALIVIPTKKSPDASTVPAANSSGTPPEGQIPELKSSAASPKQLAGAVCFVSKNYHETDALIGRLSQAGVTVVSIPHDERDAILMWIAEQKEPIRSQK